MITEQGPGEGEGERDGERKGKERGPGGESDRPTTTTNRLSEWTLLSHLELDATIGGVQSVQGSHTRKRVVEPMHTTVVGLVKT